MQWTIDVAFLSSPSVDRVVVSTDDSEIAERSRVLAELEVPFLRPPELASEHRILY